MLVRLQALRAASRVGSGHAGSSATMMPRHARDQHKSINPFGAKIISYDKWELFNVKGEPRGYYWLTVTGFRYSEQPASEAKKVQKALARVLRSASDGKPFAVIDHKPNDSPLMIKSYEDDRRLHSGEQ
tara:strand:- start:69 stop:455 length:387 start_codon:yes stop_codon:yes gene_type:complete